MFDLMMIIVFVNECYILTKYSSIQNFSLDMKLFWLPIFFFPLLSAIISLLLCVTLPTFFECMFYTENVFLQLRMFVQFCFKNDAIIGWKKKNYFTKKILIIFLEKWLIFLPTHTTIFSVLINFHMIFNIPMKELGILTKNEKKNKWFSREQCFCFNLFLY